MGNSKFKPTSIRSWFSPGSSFRLRLIWSNVLLVAAALIGATLFSLYRSNQTSAFLTDELTQSVALQTENEINAVVSQRTADLDLFFSSVVGDMTTLNNTIRTLLGQEANLSAGAYWDARQALTTLAQGSWDNPNNEPGSVFLPAQAEIPDSIYSELNTVKQIDFVAPAFLQKNSDILAVYFGSQQGATLYYPNIDLAAILPSDFDVTQRPWFLAAAPAQNPERLITWSTPYEDAALHGLVITASVPIYDSTDTFRGVAAIDLQLTKISELIASIQIGQTGYAFLVDDQGRVIAITEAGLADFNLSPEDIKTGETLEPILAKVSLDLFGTLARMTSHQAGLRTLPLNGVEKYIAYRPVPSVNYSLGIVVPVEEMQTRLSAARQRFEKETRATLLQIAGVTLLILALSVIISRWLGNTLTSPLVQLTGTAERFAAGALDSESKIDSRDEIGILAKTFNNMAVSLRAMLGSLEQRVAERTADLEKTTIESITRAEELQAVSEVARAVSTETNFENLLTLVTNVVSKRFGFYHVGVFLLDEINKNAVLRASNSPGGRRMVARGHKLSIGQVGIVGHVADTGEARIALDVGDDAVYFNNPDLPETRSEMALPLSLRGRIIGVLDVQSTQSNAFTTADVETISILADQIAIAIENARLLAESQHALAESQSLYGDYIGRTWGRKTAQSPIGYYYASGAGQLINEPVEWDEVRNALKTGRLVVSTPSQKSRKKETNSAVAVPIRLQNQVIGILDIRSADPDRTWTEDEIAVIEATAERLALALENARLFEETSGRAAREHAVAEITSKIRNTNDPQVMIRTAIQELQRVLGASRVEIIPQVVSAHLPGREHGNDEPKQQEQIP